MRALAGGRTLSKAVAAIVVAGAIGLLLAGAGVAAGQASLSAIDTAYTQDFNTLASTGQSDVVPVGWAFSELGTNANTHLYRRHREHQRRRHVQLRRDRLVRARVRDAAQRHAAFRRSAPRSPTTAARPSRRSTSPTPVSSGAWARSGRGADRLDFQYNLTATSLTQASGWVDVDSLDFSSPVTVGNRRRAGRERCRRTAPRSAGTITGLSIAPGQTFWLRWADFNVRGSDDGLAVDDFSLTPHAAAHDLGRRRDRDRGRLRHHDGRALPCRSPRRRPAGGVTFDIATSDDSAHAPDDYTAASVTGADDPGGRVDVHLQRLRQRRHHGRSPTRASRSTSRTCSGVDAGDTHARRDDPQRRPPAASGHPRHPGRDAHLAGRRAAAARPRDRHRDERRTGFWMQDPSPDADYRHLGGDLRLHELSALGRRDRRLRPRAGNRAGVPARRVRRTAT